MLFSFRLTTWFSVRCCFLSGWQLDIIVRCCFLSGWQLDISVRCWCYKYSVVSSSHPTKHPTSRQDVPCALYSAGNHSRRQHSRAGIYSTIYFELYNVLFFTCHPWIPQAMLIHRVLSLTTHYTREHIITGSQTLHLSISTVKVGSHWTLWQGWKHRMTAQNQHSQLQTKNK